MCFNFCLWSISCIPIGIASSAVGLKICAITVGNKKYKSIIKKKRKKYDRIVLLGEAKLHIIEDLLSKALIVSYISHDKFVSVNNVLEKHNEDKEQMKNPQNGEEYDI